jgi:hypothetical protein
MDKKHYQHFIKVYNRRKRQKMSELTNLGYTCVKVNINNTMLCSSKDAERHCKRYVRDGAWIRSGDRFIFAYDKDATLFTLKFV